MNKGKLMLHPGQAEIYNDSHRFRVIVAGRRWGKTRLSLVELLRASAKPRSVNWYVAPTYTMCRSIMWKDLQASVPKQWIQKIHDTRLEITLVNGAQVALKGVDSPDCYDDQTEILTDSGWKLFKDLDKTELVLTLNPQTLVAEYKKPSRYINEDYTGKMFKLNNKKLDLLVTPEHRFFIKSQKGVYKFKTLDDISQKDAIPASVGWEGIDDQEITEDRCALMGFFLADGSAYGSMGGDIKKRKGNYEVVFCKRDEVKGGLKGNVRKEFSKILDRLGYSYRETKIGLHVLNKDLWSELREVGNRYEKFIPQRYKNLPQEKLKTLLHWMVMGDGTISKSGMRMYYTTSKNLADDVQEIAIKAGFGATIRIKPQNTENPIELNGRLIIPKKTLYQVSIYKNQYNYFRNTKDGSYISEDYYSGKVYCVEVENHVVMVRRSGKICWSGNSLRGVGLDFLVMDEVQDIDPEAWTAVLRPTLAVSQGRALFIGTPKGHQFLHKLYMMPDKNTEWKSWKFKTIDSPFVSISEVETARNDMDEKLYKQEFEADFVNMSGRVAHAFDRNLHVRPCPFNPDLPIWAGLDFNLNPMTCSLAQLQPNGELWIVDEITRFDSSVMDMCDQLDARFWRWIDRVVIYPDPAGQQRQHGRGESSIQILQERGFKNIKYRRKAPAQMDRINAVNRMLMSAKGDPRLFIDPSCARVIQAFEQTVYKEGTNEIDKRPGVEHWFDSASYMVEYEFPVRKIITTGISL